MYLIFPSFLSLSFISAFHIGARVVSFRPVTSFLPSVFPSYYYLIFLVLFSILRVNVVPQCCFSFLAFTVLFSIFYRVSSSLPSI